MITSENPSRHAAMTSAGADESRVSGAASEMPNSAASNTINGMRPGPLREAAVTFSETGVGWESVTVAEGNALLSSQAADSYLPHA